MASFYLRILNVLSAERSLSHCRIQKTDKMRERPESNRRNEKNEWKSEETPQKMKNSNMYKEQDGRKKGDM